ITAAVYSIVANSKILFSLLGSNYKLSGGSIAHIGVAMMLIGMLFSSGYSNIISLNNSGLLLIKEASDEFNQENVLLWLNEPRQMQEYELVYKGQYIESSDFPDYIDRTWIRPTPDPAVVVARQPVQAKNKTYFEKGDSIRIHPENTYFRVDYYKGDAFQ